jgi:hyperosmotically inducible protein
MKLKALPWYLSLALTLLFMGCSDTQSSPDVKSSVESSLSQAGLTTVKVAQNREKGVITLSGEVPTEQDKQKAAEVVRAAASTLVVANEIGVRPLGNEGDAKKIDSSLDTAIEKNFDAMVIGKPFAKDVKYASKNSVLTLSGTVESQNNRAEIESLAASVPNVKQVVNELQVKKQKATTTN